MVKRCPYVPFFLSFLNRVQFSNEKFSKEGKERVIFFQKGNMHEGSKNHVPQFPNLNPSKNYFHSFSTIHAWATSSPPPHLYSCIVLASVPLHLSLISSHYKLSKLSHNTNQSIMVFFSSLPSFPLRFLSLFLILFILQLDSCHTTSTTKKIGKGYRLISIEDSPNGGIVGLLQLKQSNTIYGPDIPLLHLYVK